MRPTPTEQAQRLREMAAIIRATAPAGRYRQTTLVPATYMEWAADTIEELLGRVVETCAGCCAPTCHACYLDCPTCGRQFCVKCRDRICPQHGDSEDQAAAVHEVLAAEGFEDDYWCPCCRAETRHDVEDSDHERDSTGCSRTCKTCDSRWSGLTGNYWTPDGRVLGSHDGWVAT